MAQALTLYAGNSASTILPTANGFVTATGGSNFGSKASLLGTASGYSELYSQGNAGAWAAAGNMGAASGHGFLYDSTSLDGMLIVGGAWEVLMRLALSVTATITAELYSRVSVYRAGVYFTLGTASLLAQTVTQNFSTYGLTFPSLPPVIMQPGDHLYTETWLNVTANANGLSGLTVLLAQLANTAQSAIGTNWDLPGYEGVGQSIVLAGQFPAISLPLKQV